MILPSEKSDILTEFPLDGSTEMLSCCPVEGTPQPNYNCKVVRKADGGERLPIGYPVNIWGKGFKEPGVLIADLVPDPSNPSFVPKSTPSVHDTVPTRYANRCKEFETVEPGTFDCQIARLDEVNYPRLKTGAFPVSSRESPGFTRPSR